MANWLNITAGAAIAVGYLTFSWSATGRSVGKQIAGLRVVDRGGQQLSLWRSFARAVLYVLLPAGLLWILASRRNASLQDLIVGTAVVYDWAYHRRTKHTQRITATRPARPHRRGVKVVGGRLRLHGRQGVPGADSAGRIVGTSCFHCRHGR
jgi:uncharacterized RDD family membrane protein YckC